MQNKNGFAELPWATTWEEIKSKAIEVYSEQDASSLMQQA